MQQDNSKMRAGTSQVNADDRYAKKGEQNHSMDKNSAQQQVAKKSGSAAEAIERPIKQK
jgi:hypothetical protein